MREARRGETETREWTFIAKDGDRVPVRLSLSGIKDARARSPASWAWRGTSAAGSRRCPSSVGRSSLAGALRPPTRHGRARRERGADAMSRPLGAGLAEQGVHRHHREEAGRRRGCGRPGRPGGLLPQRGRRPGGADLLHVVEDRPQLRGRRGPAPALRARRRGDDRRPRRDGCAPPRSRLAEAKEQFASLFEEAPFGVMVLDLDGVVLDVNPAICGLTGRTLHELARPAGERRRWQRPPPRRPAAPPPEQPGGTSLRRVPDPAPAPAPSSTSPSPGSCFTTRTAHPNASCSTPSTSPSGGSWSGGSPTSPTTTRSPGCANRRRFDADLERPPRPVRPLRPARRAADARPRPLQGGQRHPRARAGDQLLVSVAALLTRGCASPTPWRGSGGDEFVVLLPEADGLAAEQVAADIVALVQDETCSSPTALGRDGSAPASASCSSTARRCPPASSSAPPT